MQGKNVGIIVAVAAVISGGAIAATLLTSSEDDADTMALVPKNAFLYMEGSRELSDEQRAACDDLVERFPGFDDCGAIGDKVQEALDEELAKEDLDFERDVEPWLGDDFAMFMTTDNLAEMIAQGQNQPQFDFEGGVDIEDVEAEVERAQDDLIEPTVGLLAAVTDEEQAAGFVRNVAKDQGTKFEQRAHEGTDYFYEGGGAWAVFDGHLIISTEPGMKKIIDQREADETIEDNERFATALDAAREDRLAFAYADMQPVLTAFREQPPAGFPPPLLSIFEQATEEPLTATAFLEDDAAVIETTSSASVHDLFGYTLPGGGGEDAVRNLPADSWGALGMDDLAEQVETIINLGSSAVPGGAAVVNEQFRRATGLDLQEDVLDWMGASALFIAGEGPAGLYGGMTIQTSDPATTARTILKLERLLARDGAPTKIITRSGFRGFTVRMPGQPQLGILAVDDERAVAAMGPLELLDELADGETLGETERFATIKESLGEEFALGMFFDIDMVRGMFEQQAAPYEEYTEKVRPFLEPLAHFVYGSLQEDEIARDRILVDVDE